MWVSSASSALFRLDLNGAFQGIEGRDKLAGWQTACPYWFTNRCPASPHNGAQRSALTSRNLKRRYWLPLLYLVPGELAQAIFFLWKQNRLGFRGYALFGTKVVAPWRRHSVVTVVWDDRATRPCHGQTHTPDKVNQL